jgi:hypothetical protein
LSFRAVRAARQARREQARNRLLVCSGIASQLFRKTPSLERARRQPRRRYLKHALSFRAVRSRAKRGENQRGICCRLSTPK